MIQKARRQFIVTASIAVLVVLLTVIGVINGTMRGMVQYQTNKVLHALSSWEDGETKHFFPVSGTMLTNHFIRVQVSEDGSEVSVDMARMLSLSDEDARELAEEARNMGEFNVSPAHSAGWLAVKLMETNRNGGTALPVKRG
jgi:hypothetical protein